jgi:hypothetical protein
VEVIEDKSLLRASDEPLLLGDNRRYIHWDLNQNIHLEKHCKPYMPIGCKEYEHKKNKTTH